MKDDAKPINEEESKLKLSPHTLRLLRLITTSSSNTECTRQSTRQAISILSATAARSHPIIIWDILARLYTSLTSPDESDVVGGGIVRRDNVALAMEHVAKYIPMSDQRSFLVDDHVESDNDEEMNDSRSNGRQWLRVGDFCDGQNDAKPFHLMDRVLEKGRLLLSCNESRYDIASSSNTNGAMNEYDMESDMLAKFDASVSRKDGSQDSLRSMEDFAKERISLQRNILAKRLGLGGILSSSIVQSSCDDSGLEKIVQDEDLLETSAVVFNASTIKRQHANDRKDDDSKISARDRNLERMAKRRRVEGDNDTSDIDEHDKEGEEDSSTIRTLLLLSINQYETSVKQNTNSTELLSHKTPQNLLATDMIYHSFHPSWHIRHGSLLGLRAILKAWHDSSSSLQGSSQCKHLIFGKWPQDILARCLCVLSLDRFGDFSGSSIGEHSHQISNVAPVREAAAQVIALLLDMASTRPLQESCIQTLQYLNCHPKHWEVRHGALLSLKGTLELSVCSPTHNRALNTGLKELICAVAPIMVQQTLEDKSDDVKGACVQVVSFIIHSHSDDFMSKISMTDFVVTCSKGIWQALKNLQITASCSHDLLQCLCNLVQYDCNLVLGTIESSDQPSSAIVDLLDKLCAVMEFPSPSMQLSCLKTLSVIVEPLSNTALEKEELQTGDHMVFDIAQTLCKLLIKVFESFFTNEYTIEEPSRDSNHENQNDILQVERQTAWTSILTALNLLVSRNEKNHETIRSYAVVLLELYFGMTNHKKIQSSMWTYNISSKIHHQYRCQEVAAKAVMSFYSYMVTAVKGVDGFFLIGVLSLMTSPWIEHCELACILLQNVPKEREAFFTNIFNFCKTHVWRLANETPVCLAIYNLQNIDSVRTQFNIKHLCESLWVKIVRRSCTKTFDEIDQRIAAIRRGWIGICQKVGINISDVNTGSKMVTSLASMRLSSTIGGAVVSLGQNRLPSRLTPIIRSLITLIKNEDNMHRSRCATFFLAKLITLLQLSTNEKHRNTSHKVLSNICAMACVPRYTVDSHKGFTKIGCEQSKVIVQSILVTRNANKTLEDLKPVWQRLLPLTSSNPAQCGTHSMISEAVSMLTCVSLSLKKGSKSIVHGVSTLLPTTVVLACTSPSLEIRQDAVESLKNFCRADIDLSLPMILPYIKRYSNSTADDSKRLGSCVLLNTIVRNVGLQLCPYIRQILPIAMPAMTDSLKQCADLSSSTFSLLVRLAPLVDNSGYHNNPKLQGEDQDAQKVMDHLIHGEPLPPCQLPSSILSTLKKNGIKLRDYQVEGVSWLQFLKSVRLNGALCDDMGLGKTLQALVGIAIAHNELKVANEEARPKSLIVCPSSVTGQWINELKKIGFGKDILAVMHYTGTDRKMKWDKMLEECELVITSYPLLRSDAHILASIPWLYCVLDEGHLLKNPKTLTAKSARQLRSHHKLILSGTPVQNKVHELWSAFDWLMPNYLGSDSEFSQNYARIITKGNLPGASSGEIRNSMEKLKHLHQQVLPFILRRQKSDVLKELPPKIVIDIPCAMTETQRYTYSKYLGRKNTQDGLAALDQLLKEEHERIEDTNNKNGRSLDQNVLKSLLCLRLVCTHPSLAVKDSNDAAARFDMSGKLLALNDLLRRARIVKDEITAADNDDSLLYLNDQANMTQADIMAKEDSNPEMFEEGESRANLPLSKCLIFAQFNQSLDAVENLVFRPLMPSLRYVRLDGKMNPKHRAKIVESFQLDDSIRCMLLTSKIGSLGLNLQAADTVIFLENDWNPFVDLQAMDRSHRIGQHNNVKVYRLITQESVEEKIMAVQKVKIAMSNAIVNTDNSTLFSMGTDRLLDLFTTNDN
jgi:TATA-binding protein-associated factor